MEKCPYCGSTIKKVRKLTPEEEQMVSEFIDMQFEADLLEEVESMEVL